MPQTVRVHLAIHRGVRLTCAQRPSRPRPDMHITTPLELCVCVCACVRVCHCRSSHCLVRRDEVGGKLERCHERIRGEGLHGERDELKQYAGIRARMPLDLVQWHAGHQHHPSPSAGRPGRGRLRPEAALEVVLVEPLWVDAVQRRVAEQRDGEEHHISDERGLYMRRGIRAALAVECALVRGHTFSFASSVMATEPGSVALPDIGRSSLATAVAERVAGSKMRV